MNLVPQRRALTAGSRLFERGAVADVAYLVLEGTVDLLGDGAPGTSVARRVSAGELLGAEALGGHEATRSRAAVAVTDVVLLALTPDDLARRVEDADPLLRLCVASMLEQQAAGQGSGVARWARHRAEAAAQLLVEHDLRRGLEQGELAVHYQPIVTLDGRRLAGFEALVRWQHPRRGLLAPTDFIPTAEASGIIGAVTQFALRAAAAAFPALKEAAVVAKVADQLFLSVNVSAADLAKPAFAAEVASVFADAGVEPEVVRLEITESVVMADPERCAATLQQCRDQGFRIAVDDFGTGQSSLHYVATLPISVLKMDRSFLVGMGEGAASAKIVGIILQLGRELGLAVVAEGVEQEEQAERLHRMGCAYGQGFLFGKPVSAEETLAVIAGWRVASTGNRRRLRA